MIQKAEVLKVYLVGQDNLLIRCAEMLLKRKHSVLGVISEQIDIIEWAKKKSIPSYLSLSDFKQKVAKKSFDYLFSVVNSAILTKDILGYPTRCTINYHDSFLPKYAGVHATAWAIINNENSHGVTWHVVDSGLDTGDILKQAAIPIDSQETSLSLNLKCFEKAAELFAELVKDLAHGNYAARKQDFSQRSYYGLYQKPKDDGFIDWRDSAETIERFCRALQFGDYNNCFATAKVIIKNQLFLLPTVKITQHSSKNHTPGTLIKATAAGLRVSTGTQDVVISALHDPVKNVLYRPAELVKNYKIKAGDRFKLFSLDEKEKIADIVRLTAKQESYWVKQLENITSPPELPSIPVAVTKATKPHIINIKKHSKQRITKLGSAMGQSITGVELLAAVWLIYLYRINPILTDGYTVGWHINKALDLPTSLQSCLLDYIPLNINFQKRATVLGALKSIFSNLKKLEQSAIKVDVFNRYPGLHEQNQTTIPFAMEVVKSIKSFKPNARSKITVAINETGGQCAIFSNHKLLQQSESLWLENVAGHINILFAAILQLSKEKLKSTFLYDLPLLPKHEKGLVSKKWAYGPKQKVTDESIAELFEKQAKINPNKVAVVFNEQKLSYSELNSKANQLANFLHGKGVKPNSHVAICLDPGINFIITILAVLKANAIYIPISTEYPDVRIKDIISDSKATHVISQTNKKSALKAFQSPLSVIYIEKSSYHLDSQELTFKRSRHPLDACIIYTSGSTGKPKGVILCQKAIIARLRYIKAFSISPIDRVAQVANTAFDMALFEIFIALLNGAALHLIPKEMYLHPELFANTLKEQKISLVIMTPSVLRQTIHVASNAFDDVNYVLCAAEKISVNLAIDFLRNRKMSSRFLVNAYGPTEVTMFSNMYVVRADDKSLSSIPIGKPVPNTYTSVMDKNMNVLPIGVKGELFVGGIGVASGYINQPQLNKQRFLNFFDKNRMGGNVYKTGDVARWLPIASIDYVGRKDSQVKINGFRVNLEEINKSLYQFEGIEYAITFYKKIESDASSYLIAYVICNKKTTIKNIRDFVEKHLPSHMIPNFFVKISQIPLNKNGKVDFKSLPDPKIDRSEFSSRYAAPVTQEQKILQQVWSEVLHVEKGKIGIYDNFFLFGGNSLQAAQIVHKLVERFSIKINITDIFKNPTISAIAKKIVVKNSIEKIDLLSIAKERSGVKIPLSFSQERFKILQKLNSTSPIYNVPFLLHIKGNLKVEKLFSAIATIVSRHEVLRTFFFDGKKESYQLIRSVQNLVLPMRVVNVEDVSKAVLQNMVYKEINKPFNLKNDLLFRVRVYKQSAQEFSLLFCFHHIIFDGWSLSPFCRELSSLYNEQEKASLEELPVQYIDFAIWQHKMRLYPKLLAAVDYWKKELSGTKRLEFFVGREINDSDRQGQHAEFIIPEKLYFKLKVLAKKEKISLFTLLFSAFSVLLYRYTCQETFTIGAPVANRVHPVLKDMIGCFINVLPVRIDFSKSFSFFAHLMRIKNKLLSSYQHNEFHLGDLVKALSDDGKQKFSGFFQTIFLLNEFKENDLKLNGLDVNFLPGYTETSKTDLGLEITIRSGKVTGCFEYAYNLFSKQLIDQLIGNFLILLDSIVEDVRKPIADLNILTNLENKRFLQWNNTKVNLAWQKSVDNLFVEQSEKTPQNVALKFRDVSLTYAELNQRISKLADYLISVGVKQRGCVAVGMYRSIETIVTIFAIMRVGGIYVPIDPDYPQDRINYVLEDSGSKYILVHDETIHKFSYFKASLYNVATLTHHQPLENLVSVNFRHRPAPEDIAYILYTSGSTGKPKGVLCTHRGLSNRLLWMQSAYPLDEKDVVMQKTNFCFDVSLWEIFWPLIAGAKQLIVEPALHKDPSYILNTIVKEKVTIVHFVPSMLQSYLETVDVEKSNACLRTVISSGEALTTQLRDKFFSKLPAVKLYNLYGPTEAAIDVTAFDCSQPVNEKFVPIGKPIANVELYVLDKNMHKVPVGVPGELHIGGVCLATGYTNRRLTKEKFIRNPFSQKITSAYLYKTGDLVSWLPGGNLKFIDRLDNQVKIRGFRVELAEIEVTIAQLEYVAKCVVLAQGEGSEKRLIAYIEPISASYKMNADAIKAFLSKSLPEYMIPEVFIRIEHIPLNANGKLDRLTLVNMKGCLLKDEVHYSQPHSSMQLFIAGIWKKLFKIPKVSIYDNFFSLGGNSLTALDFLDKINRKFFIELMVKDLVDNPSLVDLEKLITAKVSQRDELFKSLSLEKKRDFSYGQDLTVVPLYRHSQKKPLFLFHPIGGTIFWCLPLVQYLRQHYSIFAIQDPGLGRQQRQFSSIEELVAFYVAEIRRVQPSGPYLLAGFSSGANLAVEAASQLDGDEVAFLGLIDGWAIYPEDIYNPELFKMLMSQQFHELRGKFIGYDNYSTLYRMLYFQWQRLNIYKKHIPSKINKNIVLFKAEQVSPLYQTIDDPYNHWQKYTPGGVGVYKVPGDHETMLQEPQVRFLGEGMHLAIQMSAKQDYNRYILATQERAIQWEGYVSFKHRGDPA